ncbi:MAG: hypothetical protein ACLTXI_08685 [Collinsella sp.]
MSTRDFFKNSVLEAFGQVDPAKIGLSLLVALAMGILIYYVYKRFLPAWCIRAALPLRS